MPDECGLMNVDRYSCLTRLLRITAAVLQFVNRNEGTLSAFMHRAETLWIGEAQSVIMSDRRIVEWSLDYSKTMMKFGNVVAD